MKKEKFIEEFAITFMASYMASNYDYNCINDIHDRNLQPPVEDAFFLAESAWKKMKEYND